MGLQRFMIGAARRLQINAWLLLRAAREAPPLAARCLHMDLDLPVPGLFLARRPLCTWLRLNLSCASHVASRTVSMSRWIVLCSLTIGFKRLALTGLSALIC